MTDYIKAYAEVGDCYHKEALKLGAEFESATILANSGVVRWKVNQVVPPDDILALWRYLNKPFNYAESVIVRREEQVRMLDAYRKNQATEPSAEARAEALAAHGPGVTLVDVISGRKFTT